MDYSDDQADFNQSHLESPAYRQRLMRKINCLIAVLEVACAKVRRSLDAPDADRTRLERIQKNLTETLDVCQRAKVALERREQLPTDLPSQLAEVSNLDSLGDKDQAANPNKARNVEFQSKDEAERFGSLGPIESKEIDGVDFDELSRLLQEG